MILIITNGLLAYILGTFSLGVCEKMAIMQTEILVYHDVYDKYWVYCGKTVDEMCRENTDCEVKDD